MRALLSAVYALSNQLSIRSMIHAGIGPCRGGRKKGVEAVEEFESGTGENGKITS